MLQDGVSSSAHVMRASCVTVFGGLPDRGEGLRTPRGVEPRRSHGSKCKPIAQTFLTAARRRKHRNYHCDKTNSHQNVTWVFSHIDTL